MPNWNAKLPFFRIFRGIDLFGFRAVSGKKLRSNLLFGWVNVSDVGTSPYSSGAATGLPAAFVGAQTFRHILHTDLIEPHEPVLKLTHVGLAATKTTTGNPFCAFGHGERLVAEIWRDRSASCT